MKYVLLKDIVIPAGTVLTEAPTKVTHHADFIQADIALGKDATMHFTVPVENGYKPFEKRFAEVKERCLKLVKDNGRRS